MHPKVEELNNIRIKLGLTLYRISKEMNITEQTLRTFFKGLNEPKVGLYFKLEEYLKNKEIR
jgi:transcriptional regulator with XRE-family HTH domain